MLSKGEIMKALAKIALAFIATGALVFTANAGTVDDVKARGELRCVTSTGLAGFAYPDANGVWRGFDIDFCRATAAAVLGDSTKIKAVKSTGKTRFTILNAGEADVLWRNTTITFTRDVGVKLRFLGVNYYDGQGFMVNKTKYDIKSATELDGASVCIATGTTTELNLADYFHANGMSYEAVTIETADEGRTNYLAGRCDIYTTDASGLSAQRSTFPNPDDHIVLPEIISKEPLGPAVRHGDDHWADIVTWVLNATITAEEKGITSANVDSKMNSKDPEVLRLLGVEGNQGAELGLSKDWAYQIIKQVGNYGEIFERNIGVNTPLGIERGINGLWTDGGLIYSPPFR
jgi:general L-amino acid transport system substrate-binding protein